MSRANTIQTNWTSGELSPNLYGRVDIAKYFNGARKLRNMIPLPQGGLRRCPGTEYLGPVSNAAKTIRVVTFSFSNNDSYVLEFGDETLRIWQTGILIGVTVATPYDHTELAQLRFVQSGDVMFIAHPLYYPRTLTRNSPSSWTLATYANEDGPYLSVTPDVTLQLTGPVSDTATATAASNAFSNAGSAQAITEITRVNTAPGVYNPSLKIVGHAIPAGSTVFVTGFTSSNPAVGYGEVLNGFHAISVLDADHIILIGAWWNVDGTHTVSAGPTATFSSGSATVEFLENTVWKLARIISFSSATVAVVDIFDEIKTPDAEIKLTGSATQVTSDSPTFTRLDVGKYVRVKGTGWYYITSFTDSQTVATTAVTCVNFGDALKAITITNRVVTVLVTASAVTFASTDTGRKIRLKFGAQWLFGEITAYISTTVVRVSLDRGVPFDTADISQPYNQGIIDTWKLGAWSPTTGYPSVVSFHQNRLVWASTAAEPTTKWLTKSGDYYSFEPSNPIDSAVTDESAMTITLVSRQVNKVRWLDSGPVLLSGTEGAEWQIKPSSIQQTLTPTNVSATIQTAFGSADIDANRVGAQVVFVERNNMKLRELVYDFSIDAFASKDISILSEHLLREHDGIVDWTIQTNPYTILWLVLGDGKVASVTYEKEHDVIAWALHDFGGVVSSCTVAAADGEDEIYFIVARTVNAVAVKFVERITRILGGLGPIDQPTCYLNCHLSVNFGAVGIDTWGGMDHLIGESVGVMLDGIYLGAQVVQALGVVHVGYLGSIVQAGLPATAIVGILDPEGGSQAGTSQGKKKRISESVARVEDSYYFKTASGTMETNDTENLSAAQDPVSGDYRRIVPALTLTAPQPQGTPGTVVPTSSFALISGDVEFAVDDAFDNGARFEIVQDEPYPLNLICLAHKLNTNE